MIVHACKVMKKSCLRQTRSKLYVLANSHFIINRYRVMPGEKADFRIELNWNDSRVSRTSTNELIWYAVYTKSSNDRDSQTTFCKLPSHYQSLYGSTRFLVIASIQVQLHRIDRFRVMIATENRIWSRS